MLISGTSKPGSSASSRLIQRLLASLFEIFFLILMMPAILLSGSNARPAYAQDLVAASSTQLFTVKPYVQLGLSDRSTDATSVTLLWDTPDIPGQWSVEIAASGSGEWHRLNPPAVSRVAMETSAPFRSYSETVTGLAPGCLEDYRIVKDAKPVFVSQFIAPKDKAQPYRFVVFGDLATGSRMQAEIAYRSYQAKPDFVFMPGDIVYQHGRILEYLAKYFPVYNADHPDIELGAPLIRSTLSIAAVGNHDVASAELHKGHNLDIFPDGMGYFLFWSQPLNGPPAKLGASCAPILAGDSKCQQAFLHAAGARFPQMTNFSFNYGNSHWLVLDANNYMDWTNKTLRDWISHDLEQAADATWRFVGFHQPGFSSGKAHSTEQRMRLLSDLFEKGKVDVVFSGHVHNYQRSRPLSFVPEKNATGRFIDDEGRVSGTLTIDQRFDGSAHTHPRGIIYIVSGAGGAPLYGTHESLDPSLWQKFTAKFIATSHSFTLCSVKGSRLDLRQIAADGTELDHITITK